MRLFESLNCVHCKEPFARVANQPHSPMRLNCGLIICHNCMHSPSLTKHQCRNVVRSLHYYHNAYYLIELLSQEDALILAPGNRGYLLAKPFKVPECPVCYDKYSNKVVGKKASCLQCCHVICMQCSLKMQRRNTITCPVCRLETVLVQDPEENRFNDFLDELPKMMRQMEETRSCEDCQKMGQIDEMFHCPECSSNSCGFCAYKKHHAHKAISLLEMEVGAVSKELQNVCETYTGLFPVLHDQLLQEIDAFKAMLILEGETLKDASSTAILKEKHEALTRLRTDFETTAKEYCPQLRKIDTKVKEWIRALGKSNTQQDRNI